MRLVRQTRLTEVLRMRSRIIWGTTAALIVGCGTSDNDVAAGGASSAAAAPTTIASGAAATPSVMVSDGTSLFMIDSGTAKIETVSVAGGAVTTFLDQETQGTFLAVDSDNVYAIGSFGGAPSALAAIPKTGGTARVLSDKTTSVVGAVLNGNTVYWADAHTSGPVLSTVTIHSENPTTGMPTVLATFQAKVSGTALLGVVSGTLYFDSADEAPTEVPLTAGSDAGTSATSLPPCEWLLSTTPDVYCVAADGPIHVIDGVGKVSSLAFTTTKVTGAAADDTAVYWADNPAPGGAIRKATPSGVASVIANEAGVAVAVDSNAVYWANSKGEIRRSPK